MYTTIIRERNFTLGGQQFLWSDSDDVCMKKDGISPAASQTPSVKSLSLMMVVTCHRNM
jgi:hypothetical protein